MPKVLNARIVGTKVKGAVYCGRPSKFGNPFQIGDDETRSDVIVKHREWFLLNDELKAQARKELRGKDLICWCAPKPCHCDIILKIANEDDLTEFFG